MCNFIHINHHLILPRNTVSHQPRQQKRSTELQWCIQDPRPPPPYGIGDPGEAVVGEQRTANGAKFGGGCQGLPARTACSGAPQAGNAPHPTVPAPSACCCHKGLCHKGTRCCLKGGWVQYCKALLGGPGQNGTTQAPFLPLLFGSGALCRVQPPLPP